MWTFSVKNENIKTGYKILATHWFFFKFEMVNSQKSAKKQTVRSLTHPTQPQGFPGGASGIDPACKCRRCKRHGFYPWVGKIPRRRERLPTPLFWPGEFHTLYSPRGPKESDRTERLAHHLNQMAKVLELLLQLQSFQWIFRVNFF